MWPFKPKKIVGYIHILKVEFYERMPHAELIISDEPDVEKLYKSLEIDSYWFINKPLKRISLFEEDLKQLGGFDILTSIYRVMVS